MPGETRNQRRAGSDATATGLSRERIARAALELADQEGLEAVSIRRLARELGAGPMTLYRYFPSKEELLDAAVDLAASEVAVTVEGETWKDELRALMRSVRDGLMRHPSGVRLRLTGPLLSTGALRITESGMEILVRAGFDRQQAAHAYRALFVYTFGSVSFTSTEVPAQLVRRVRSALVALPPDEYPTLSAAAQEAAETHTGDAQFDFGLDRLLDGLEALLNDRVPGGELR